jgi:hypothetical protein
MSENLVLLLFGLAPCLAALTAYQFFVRSRRSGDLNRMRSLVAGNFLVLLFLITMLLPAGEIYFRFIYDSTDALDSTKVSEKWFSRHYRSNRAGCRDDTDYAPKIAPGKRRVTFLGDSFTAGHGIKNTQDRFANRIRAAHPDWEIHILARPGFDTGNEIKSLDVSLQAGYQLDLVVLVYCLNDISDILPESTAATDQVYADVDSAGWLRRNSYLVNTIYYRFKLAKHASMGRYFSILEQGYRGPTWQQQTERLRSLQDMVVSHGGHLSIVTFPFFDSLERGYKFGFVHEELDQFWQSINVPHLDLRLIYGSFQPSKLIVNRYDSHPNEYANKLAAVAIDRLLSAQITNSWPASKP